MVGARHNSGHNISGYSHLQILNGVFSITSTILQVLFINLTFIKVTFKKSLTNYLDFFWDCKSCEEVEQPRTQLRLSIFSICQQFQQKSVCMSYSLMSTRWFQSLFVHLYCYINFVLCV